MASRASGTTHPEDEIIMDGSGIIMDEGAALCDVSQIIDEFSPISNPNTNFDQQEHDDDSLLQPTFSQIANADDASSKHTVAGLKELYHNHVVDAEKKYHLHFNFCLPTDGEIKDSEFDATPMVLLIGQYSTGKTTFLNHLLGEDFPGMHIGPEPTTDKFMALFHDGGDGNNDNNSDKKKYTGFRKRKEKNDDGTVQSNVTDDIRASGRLVKGNTLTVTPTLPFSSLSQFGSAFLNHFVGSSSNSPLLKRLTFVDTPGVLSGEKQRINRPYDFAQVAKWFADRSDLILLLFDAHKLDISDEFKKVIDTIRLHNDDKIRCVLNKADCVTREQLVRVYGSLMWSMGKIFHSPEVVRVYTGSYWNGSLINNDFEGMFGKDEKLLVQELIDLPRDSAERKVNQMVNRIRLVKVHVCILGTLSKMTPRLFGKKESRAKILNELDAIMDNARVEFDLSHGDMPDSHEFAGCLKNFPDFSVFPSIDRKLISRLDLLIEEDVPAIVSDADAVARDVRLGRRNTVEEQERIVETDPATMAQDQLHGDELNVPSAIGLPWKFAIFCLVLLSVLGGGYYLPKPEYSLSEVHRKILNILVDHPKVSVAQSKVSSPSNSQRPTKSSTPLSTLPSVSGIAYTSSKIEQEKVAAEQTDETERRELIKQAAKEEAGRDAGEKSRLEAERLVEERLAAGRKGEAEENTRLEAERLIEERLTVKRKAEAEEKTRLEAGRLVEERLAAERKAEAEEKATLEAERLDVERYEAERKAARVTAELSRLENSRLGLVGIAEAAERMHNKRREQERMFAKQETPSTVSGGEL